MSIQIRDFIQEDAEETYRLFYDTVHNVNIKDYSLSHCNIWAPKETNIENWRASLMGNYSFVAIDNKTRKIVGFSDLEDDGYLNRGYVHMDYQGQGIGKMLLEVRENKAKELGIRRLYSNVSKTAKPFYIKQGYQCVRKQQRELEELSFEQYRMEKTFNSQVNQG